MESAEELGESELVQILPTPCLFNFWKLNFSCVYKAACCRHPGKPENGNLARKLLKCSNSWKT